MRNRGRSGVLTAGDQGAAAGAGCAAAAGASATVIGALRTGGMQVSALQAM
jgi:hypothetical protein